MSVGAESVLTAAIYARVSSTGQMGRGDDDDGDGYSIPAQVEACEREAHSLGARLAIRPYIERAESARSDNRPVLQKMLKELPALGVKYLIVHKVDRLARNRLDDALLYERLVGMGIRLASATENIDETPAGRLMHGMLATFAEYYSNNLATEVRKGLRRKHENGGTPFKPPLGYKSKRTLVGNQDIRTVIVDKERAHFIQEAFDLYATGNWTTKTLAAHLEQRGLRSRETPKVASRPVKAKTIQEVLRNPYYMGVVIYCGRRATGRHKPLVDPDTFDRVQALLSARSVAGDRPHKHQHYLRGSLYCAVCGGRLLYSKHRGNGGEYEYFCCIGRTSRRQGGRCPSRHYSVPEVEAAIAEHYRTVHVPGPVREAIWADVRRDADERTAIVVKDIERHQRKIETLEANQTRLVQMSYEGLVSNEVLATEQQRLEAEKHQAQRLLEAAELHASDIETALDGALAKTKTPHATYVASTPLERRLLNQTFFKRILVGEEGTIESTELTTVYAALATWEPSLGRPRHLKAVPSATESNKKNPDPVFRGQGSHNAVLVELIGVLSNHDLQGSLGRLAGKLAALRAGDVPVRPNVARPSRRHRHGWVLNAVVQVLSDREEPMRAKDIHAAVEALLGERVGWSSVKMALASNVSGPSRRFVRVARGRYVLA
jgi:site-specific DNA recombinase